MMRRLLVWVVRVVVASLLILAFCGSASAQEGVARAVLFFSRTCPHCQIVVSDHLPGFFQATGGMPRLLVDSDVPESERSVYLLRNDRLEVLLVDVAGARGGVLYEASTASHRIPAERQGVPRLVIGATVLVGSGEIPDLFPGLVDSVVHAGGIDWPDFGDEDLPGYPPLIGVPIAPAPGVAAADDEAPVRTAEPEPETPAEVATTPARTPPTARDDTVPLPVSARTPPRAPERGPEVVTPPGDTAGVVREDTAREPEIAAAVVTDSSLDSANFSALVSHSNGFIDNFRRDVRGGTMAVLVMLGIAVAVVAVLARTPDAGAPSRLGRGIPLVALAGLGVSTYLSFVETTGATAVCGPVGDCNAVQQSEYATLFGFLPVAVLGAAGYLVILTGWLLSRSSEGRTTDVATAVVYLTAIAGALFSVYLTFLEPFVIGATCAWCLSSAVGITILMWLSAPAGKRALSSLRLNHSS